MKKNTLSTAFIILPRSPFTSLANESPISPRASNIHTRSPTGHFGRSATCNSTETRHKCRYTQFLLATVDLKLAKLPISDRLKSPIHPVAVDTSSACCLSCGVSTMNLLYLNKKKLHKMQSFKNSNIFVN